MLDLLKVIDDSPMTPVWKEFKTNSGKAVRFLIAQLDTTQADVLTRKSSVKVKGRDGKIKNEHDQTKWRRLLFKACLKDWEGMTPRDVLEICLADVSRSGLSDEQLAMKAVFDEAVAIKMADRNLQFALFVQSAAMEIAEELADELEEEKKT